MTIKKSPDAFNTRLAALSPAQRLLLDKSLLKKTTILNQSKITVCERDKKIPLSFPQQMIWFTEQISQNKALFINSRAFTISGNLKLNALEKAFTRIISRHEILRTSYTIIDGKPFQSIHNNPQFTINRLVLTQGTSDTEIQNLLNSERNRPFNLSSDLVLRVCLLQLEPNEHILILSIHHIASDEWSIGLICRELMAFYPELADDNTPALAKLAIQYADFSVWQKKQSNSRHIQLQLKYWQEQLANSPVLLELPTDYQRPRKQSYKGKYQTFSLETKLTEQLISLSQQFRATLFMTLLTAFNILLSRYSHAEDIVIGTPIVVRNKQEIEPLIGCFINTLAIRNKLSNSATFIKLLSQVKQTCLDAFKHQDIPFEQVLSALKVNRDTRHAPLFQNMFSLHNTPQSELKLSGLEIQNLAINKATAQFDLTLIMRQTNQGLSGHFEYNTELFDDSTITRMIDHFKTLLKSIINNPQQSISSLSLLTQSEQRQLLIDWNQTQVNVSQNQTLIDLFQIQAELRPNDIAVIYKQNSLSYQQLNQKSNQLAHHLISIGVEPETLIAVNIERSLDMLIVLFGILKAGAAYLPIDSFYPNDRIDFMLSDSKAQLIITHSNLLAQLDSTIKTICIDKDAQFLFNNSKANPNCNIQAHQLAYVIYTSGSTGRPKGVQIEHKALLNFLLSFSHTPGIEQKDTLLAVTTLSFDIAALELFLPLINGAKIHLLSRENASNGFQLADILSNSSITIMQATPATWRLLLESGWQGSSQLKVLIGGEALARELANQLVNICQSVWNLYGPTESTIWSSLIQVKKQINQKNNLNSIVPIGKAIANTQIYLLDNLLQVVPIGVTGELHIAGHGLARGYLNLPEFNLKKFIRNPFSQQANTRLYKTGDFARYLSDGTIEFIGRSDTQVKLNGFRIELGEIESLLRQYPIIQEALVTIKSDDTNKKRLLAYILVKPSVVKSSVVEPCVIKPKQNFDHTQLLDYLKQNLPHYMLPSAIVEIVSIPLMYNGKIDYSALPSPAQNVYLKTETNQPPQGKLEQQIAKVWKNLLSLSSPDIDRNNNFFDCGGDSFSFVQLASMLESELKINFPINDLLQSYSIKEQAIYIQSIKNPSPNMQQINLDLGEDDIKRLLIMANGKTQDQHPEYPLIFPYNEQFTKTPLFFINGGDYLASQLQRPYFEMLSGFDVIPLSEKNRSALARYYADSISSIVPNGPYFLGGYCSGGLLAYEIATFLLAQKKEVPLLILVDQSLPHSYSGRIAFMPFAKNDLIEDLLRLKDSSLLKQYYSNHWTIDALNLTHEPEITYPGAILLGERIEARIEQLFLTPNNHTLSEEHKICDFRVIGKEIDDEKIVLHLNLLNKSQILWANRQIAIKHLWLNESGSIIQFSHKSTTIQDSISPGSEHSLLYPIKMVNESGKFKLIIILVDLYGTWFSSQIQLTVDRQIKIFENHLPDIDHIKKLIKQGGLNEAIQSVQQHVHLHGYSQADILVQLSDLARKARGAKDSLSVNKIAMKYVHEAKEIQKTYQNLAENYYALEQYDEAIKYADRAIEKNNDDYRSISYLALSHGKKQNYQKAFNILKNKERLLNNIYPKDFQSGVKAYLQMYYQAVCHRKTNIKFFTYFAKKITTAEPNIPIYFTIYGDILITQKKYALAEKTLKKALAISPFINTIYEKLYGLYLKQNKFEDALCIQYQICELKPFSIEAHETLLNLLQHQKLANEIVAVREKIKLIKNESSPHL